MGFLTFLSSIGIIIILQERLGLHSHHVQNLKDCFVLNFIEPIESVIILAEYLQSLLELFILFALDVMVGFIIFAISFYLLFMWSFIHSVLIFLLIFISLDAMAPRSLMYSVTIIWSLILCAL